MAARQSITRIVVAALLTASWAHGASAQTLGTYRFRLEPLCNVLTLTVVQVGTTFTLDGFDDLCGAATRASASGIAFPNPDQTIGFGLTLVLAPHAEPIHVDATLNLATLGGTWHDSMGNSGALIINPTTTAGSPRSAPIPSTVVPATQFGFHTDGGFVARGAQDVGRIPEAGAGTRLMWYPGKAAFRAGQVTGTHWDDANVGAYSVALGRNPTATNNGSIALGNGPEAHGPNSIAIGAGTLASGDRSVAMGSATTASGASSVAIGQDTTASSGYATAIGFDVIARGVASVALGSHADTNGHSGAFVFGDGSPGLTVVASANRQFTVRSAGGARFFSNGEMTMGVELKPGAGSWTQVSDAARKHNFSDLDGEDVLFKLRAMPIREWSYLSQDAAIRHVGPTAQDFRAAFGLGEDPLGITTIDAEGIALRAIQALEARTAMLQEDNTRLARDNDALRHAIDAIRQELAILRAGQRR